MITINTNINMKQNHNVNGTHQLPLLSSHHPLNALSHHTLTTASGLTFYQISTKEQVTKLRELDQFRRTFNGRCLIRSLPFERIVTRRLVNITGKIIMLNPLAIGGPLGDIVLLKSKKFCGKSKKEEYTHNNGSIIL